MDLFNEIAQWILAHGQPNLLLAVIEAVVVYIWWGQAKKFSWYDKIKAWVQIIDGVGLSIISYVVLGIMTGMWGNGVTFLMAGATGLTAAGACQLGYEGLEKLIKQYFDSMKNKTPAVEEAKPADGTASPVARSTRA